MASFVLTLDTTPPQAPAILVNGGASEANDPAVSVEPLTSDPDTTGYWVLIWGDVDPGVDPDIQATEGASTWIPWSPELTVQLAEGNSIHALSAKLRDDVGNVTGELSATILLTVGAGSPPPLVIRDDRPFVIGARGGGYSR